MSEPEPDLPQQVQELLARAAGEALARVVARASELLLRELPQPVVMLDHGGHPLVWHALAACGHRVRLAVDPGMMGDRAMRVRCHRCRSPILTPFPFRATL